MFLLHCRLKDIVIVYQNVYFIYLQFGKFSYNTFQIRTSSSLKNNLNYNLSWLSNFIMISKRSKGFPTYCPIHAAQTVIFYLFIYFLKKEAFMLHQMQKKNCVEFYLRNILSWEHLVLTSAIFVEAHTTRPLYRVYQKKNATGFGLNFKKK